MANFVPNWVGTDSLMTALNFMSTYTVGQNPNFSNGTEPSGVAASGSDPSLGIGQFVYAQMSNAAGCNQGDVCELTATTYTPAGGSSVSVVLSTQQWAGTANSGKTLCVALTTMTQNQFGWFQIYGAALVNVSGAFAAGSSAYWNALGKVQSTAVASKQMVSAQGLVAPSATFGQTVQGVTPALPSTQAIIFINNPHAQSAIT